MSTLRSAIFALALYALSAAAQAMPIKYELSFSDTGYGIGVGEFFWDAESSLMTGFSWTFGSYGAGDLQPFDLGRSLFGGTSGGFLFELITGEDTHPSGGTGRSSYWSYSWTGIFTDNWMTFSSTGLYTIDSYPDGDLGGGVQGFVTARPATTLPEPGTLGLALLGLAGLALNRMRKHR